MDIIFPLLYHAKLTLGRNTVAHLPKARNLPRWTSFSLRYSVPPLRSENVLRVVEQRLDDDVLLHHVEREVLLGLEDGAGVGGGGRPHEGGAEDDGQVGDLHPVRVLLLDDAEEVAQQGGQGGAVRRGHGR